MEDGTRTSSERDGKMRVLVVDDHPMVCDGLEVLINGQPDLCCCGSAGNSREALAQAAREKPDIMLLDLRLGPEDGLDLIGLLLKEAPAARILVVSQLDERVFSERALRAGAQGYVMKAQATDQLLKAIRQVLGGELYVSERVAMRAWERILQEPPPTRHSRMGALSERELAVFEALGAGKSKSQIANEMELSIRTVETYREHAKYKLGLSSTADLVQCAREWVASGQQGRIVPVEEGLRSIPPQPNSPK
jgi:DNA-binding NarL/FixJ family response regulator